MNENNINNKEDEEYSLYTEKIVQSPKVKYKKYINGLKTTAIVVGIVVALAAFIHFVIPWYGEKFPKRQENKDELTIEKDEYSADYSEPQIITNDVGSDKLNLDSSEDEDLTKVNDYESVMAVLRSRVSDIQKSIVVIDRESKDITQIVKEESSETENCGLVIGYVNSEYLILTKLSALDDSDSLLVKFSTGEELEGKVCGRDANIDVAIVSINATQMSYTMLQSVKVAKLDNSYNVHQGDLFLAYGKLYGQNKAVDYGTISEISDRVGIDNTYEIFNSNLAYNEKDYSFIFNADGNVIGVSTSSTGKNMKVMGISDMKAVIEALVNKGNFAYFGIGGCNVTGRMADTYGFPMGIYVSEVEIDSPAFDAGLQAGDIIYGINGNSVLTIQVFSEKLYQCNDEQVMLVKAQRKGKDGYYDVFFNVTVRMN